MHTITDAAIRRKSLHDRLDTILDAAEAHAKDPEKIQDFDRLVRERMLDLGEGVVCLGVDSATERLRQAPMPACPKCAKRLQFKQFRKTQIRTALTGEPQTVRAPVAVCPGKCPVLLNLVRHEMRLDADGCTPRLRELVTMAGTIEPFEHASASVLGELAGITMSANGIHSICQEAGAVANELMQAGKLGDARQLKPGEVLYVMADGCMLWIGDGWHEVKFAVIFPAVANVEVSRDRRQTTERQVICTLGDREDLGQAVWNAVERWLPPDGHGGVRTKDRIVFISDGSLWLQHMAEAHLPGAFVLLDWYHMAEHVAATAKTLYGENEIATFQWRMEQQSMLMGGRVEAMVDGLAALAADPKWSTEARESLKNLHGFLDKRRRSLRYSTAQGRGYLIGSGPAESAANHVVQQRMKRAGMRWERDGAGAMLALRAAWRSTGGFRELARAA
jgi:hypothetical protein